MNEYDCQLFKNTLSTSHRGNEKRLGFEILRSAASIFADRLVVVGRVLGSATSTEGSKLS